MTAAVPLPDHADHIAEIAARLRRVARSAGVADLVPEDDQTAVGCIFSVLGRMASAMERGQAAAPKAEAVAYMRRHPHGFGRTVFAQYVQEEHRGHWTPLYSAPQPPAEREPLTPDALADRCEAWLQRLPIADAPNIVDAFEAGFRDGERAHGISTQPKQENSK